ncbi:MAG TPA: hypothetical protein VGB19_02385 [Actinomycetota bacterium]
MDLDFTALASRVAARAEVLGCVLLSRDGLVLGSFPPNGERDITPGLLRFAALGEPERGFVQFSDELWAYVRQDSYAAFAVAEAGTRPGVLLDYLEQALQVAEEARYDRTAAREPVHVDLNRKGIRPGRILRAMQSGAEDEFRSVVTSQPAPEPAGPPAADQGDAAVEMAVAEAVAQAGEPQPAPAFEASEPRQAPPSTAPGFSGAAGGGWGDAPAAEVPQRAPYGDPEPPTAEAHPRTDEIDRVALAREFASLLQEGPGGVEEGR